MIRRATSLKRLKKTTQMPRFRYLPAMIRVESETGLIVKAETVSEKLGQDWDIQSLQLT